MSETDIAAVEMANAAVEAIRAAGIEDISARRLDTYTGREGVCVRPYSVRTVEEYMDGTVVKAVTLQIVARRRDAASAMECCSSAARAAVSDGLGADNGAALVVDPYELKLDEEDFHAWAARVEGEFTEEGF